MNRPTRLLACLLACSLGGLFAAEAQAQLSPGSRQGSSAGLSVPAPLPDPNMSAGRIGMRLEPGAVLCRTPEGLGQRQAAMTAANGGDSSYAVVPTGCVMLTARTAVEVMERRGVGRTMVKLGGRSAETGWTDAYLPAR